MGLFAALSAGVSGLDSQSNKIGIISNNIANVNTTGYKQEQAAFDTLVVPSGTTTFSPGGVIGDTQQLVNVQGTISASSSATDVAISGAGFFVVNSNATGTGNTYYTRAGSFTQDSNGDFINSDGYYLMGLPINSEGATAEPNAQNLSIVSVSQSATGAATATSNVAVTANLNASQPVLPGNSATATMSAGNNTSTVNQNATGNQIIVGNDYGATSDTTNDLMRGDTMQITSTGTSSTVTDTLTYGGFTVGRDVTDGTNGDGGNTLVEDAPGAGFSTFDATSFAEGTGDIDAATPVLTLDANAQIDGTLSSDTTLTIGGNTITFGGGNDVAIGGSLSTTLQSLATYLNTNSPGAPFSGLTFSTNGTSLFAVNTTGTAITSGVDTTYTNTPTGVTGGGGAPVLAAGQTTLMNISAADLPAGSTFTIGSTTITMIPSGATAGADEVNVGASVGGTLTNLQSFFTTNAAALGYTGFTFGTTATTLTTTNGTGGTLTPPAVGTFTAGTPATATEANNATLPASSPIGTFSDGPIVAGDTITVSGQVFNFVNVGGGSGNIVNVGANLGDTLNALVTRMNANATLQGDGLTFSSASASADSGTLYAQDNQGIGSTPISASYTNANIANTTYSALTNFNVANDSSASAVGGAGQLSAGLLIADGAPAITLTAGENLNQIAAALQLTLRTLTGGSASTVTVTGTAGNFSLLVQDTSGAGLGGFDTTNSTALATTLPTYNVVSPDSTPASSQIAIKVNNAGDYTLGQYVNISGVTSAIGGIPADDINGELKVMGVNVGTDTVIVAANNGATFDQAVSNVSGGTDVTVTNRSYNFTGSILNATSATDDFLTTGAAPLTASDFASDAMHFKITVGGGTPEVFTYSTTPDPAEGTFNNLDTLAQAISDAPGLTATVADNRLYVSATNANDSVVFNNGDSVGNGTLPGINWTQELGLQNIPPAATGTTLFNSLQGLATAINTVDPNNLTAVVNNPDAASTLSITEANPEQTINFSDGVAPTGQAQGSVLKELGFANLSPDTTVGTGAFTTGTLGITYSPSSSATDMSSGAVTPQFSHDITVYDAQGTGHTLALNFVKLATNTWGVELTATPASEVTGTTTGDGQLANGIIKFNGNGGISSVSGTIAGTINMNWSDQATPSQIMLNFGLDSTTTTSASAALTQSAGGFNVSDVVQNGSPTGELTGVTIDQNGFVIANFSNGQTQKLYQLPLASVNNPDGLEAVSGNAYQQTLASGIANLQLAGTSGVGTFTPSALEASNVDLSTQLTDLIVAQQAYGANSKLLTVADTLLQELDQIIQ